MRRWFVLLAVGLLGVVPVVLALAVSAWWWFLGVPLLALLGLGLHDVLQRQHSVLRNYPVLGHLRYVLESVRPEVQQYFIERDYDGRPFDRDVRSIGLAAGIEVHPHPAPGAREGRCKKTCSGTGCT